MRRQERLSHATGNKSGMTSKPASKAAFWFAGVWMVFNLSLAIWWMIFGLKQAAALQEIHHSALIDAVKQQTMLISEGLILIISLLLGGGALLYYTALERRRSFQIKEFFATFSHDLKTALASLRLQAETLSEDLKGQVTSPVLERLLKDTVRLELQLENSLQIANADSSVLFLENLSFMKLLQMLKHQWPTLQLSADLKGHDDCLIRADHRALESIFKNLTQNAIIHGGAGKVSFEFSEEGEDGVQIIIEDDGKGFEGDAKHLGKIFTRHSRTSGSGVGLYLVKTLTQAMGGTLDFDRTKLPRFSVVIHLKGAFQ